MNFRNLNYFLAVASELNITKTAERLYMSQQALSNQISKMEKELGIQLFERTPRLSLTLAGKRLQEAAVRITDIYDQFLHEVDDINNNYRGELRIGISIARGSSTLPKILPTFQKMYPMIDIVLIESSSTTMEERLATGMIDVLLGAAPMNLENAVITKLNRERMFLVVPREVMLRRYGDRAAEMTEKFNEGVDIREFSDEPFILLDKKERVRHLIDRVLQSYGVKLKLRLETHSVQTTFALSLEGMGLTVCPEYFLLNEGIMRQKDAKQACLFPLINKGLDETLIIAYNRDRYLSKPISDFIQCAKDILGQPQEQ